MTRLLLDETLATAALTGVITGALATLPMEAVIVPGLTASSVGADDAALIAVGEFGFLQETHAVSPALAVVFDKHAPIKMRTPVRPDEVERTAVRLVDTSRTAELLARATLRPFYGIEATAYTDDPAAEAAVVIVEGPMALMPAEAGFDEDLARAWFILTSEALVSHVLVVPAGLDAEGLARVVAAAQQLRETAEHQRRVIRGRTVEATGLDVEALKELATATRWTLGPKDRRALLLLLQLGNPGRDIAPYVSEVRYAGE
jgi:hypothetical protein